MVVAANQGRNRPMADGAPLSMKIRVEGVDKVEKKAG
jgi:hypothetical protein